MNWEEIQGQWEEINIQISQYFSNLTPNEWYGWGLEVLGLLFFLAGIILFLL